MANRVYRRVDSVSQMEADDSFASEQSRNGENQKTFPYRTGVFCLSFLRKMISSCRDRAVSCLYAHDWNWFTNFLHTRQDRQKLTASVLTFVMLFQTIAGVFVPKDIFHLWNDQVANAGWFDGGYGYRKEIKIDHAKVAGNLTNFPVLVSFTDVALKTTTNGGKVTSTSGYDIIFTNASGSQKLDHEIEKYDGSAGKIVMWVKIPTLSSSADTSIYMYYGNSAISASQENKTGVWDDGGSSNFKGVWHLGGNVSNGVAGHLDSTQYANNGTPNNFSGTATSTTNAAGQIGGADMFDGTDDYINARHNNSLNIINAISVEGWVKLNAYASADSWSVLLGKFGTWQNSNYYLTISSNGKVRYIFGDGSSYTLLESASSISIGPWHHIVATRSGTSAANQKIFIDGVEQLVTGAADRGYNINDNDLLLSFVSSAYALNGTLDEVRIADTARSADWIATEYNNQSNPTEFYSLGIEEVSSPAQLSSFGYRKAITIDHAKVAGDLTSFPILINLPADTSLQAHAQADADDILFTSSGIAWNTGTINDKLALEIESYNSTTGSLTAWVKIPNLSSTADTVIYMYYGNTSVTSQQNKTAVWDNNTKMVQHMNQTGAGAAGDFKDSTQYANNSTNAIGQPTIGAGQIGSAESFDGVDDYVSVGNNDSLNSTTHSMSVEVWFKYNGAGTSGKSYWTLLNKDSVLGGFSYNDQYHLYINATTANLCSRIGDGVSDRHELDSGVSSNDGKWHHGVLVKDANSQMIYLYVDGIIRISGPGSYQAVINNSPLTLGVWTAYADYFNGSIDEVRIADTARSAQWIATEYANQSNPTEFYSLGIEQVSSPVSLSSFGYRKAITIDHTKVSGDLVNFPVLVNLPEDTSLQAHAQTDGDDILFTASSTPWNTGTVNDKLAHEIETYTSSNGSLQAWVKIPDLSSANDTVIYMYYGNTIASNQQNKTAVWDSNTKMVQHMNQNPGGSAPQMIDSTQYANNGTSGGSMTPANQTVGQIDGAVNFDGTDDFVSAGNNGSLKVGNSNITVSAWVKAVSTPSNYGRIVGSGSTSWYTLRFNSNKYLTAEIYDGTNARGIVYNQAFDNNLHYVVLSVDKNSSTGMKLWVDGLEVVNGNPTNVGYISNDIYAGIGGGIQNQYLSGSIDEVRIADTARSAQWIATEYANQSNPTEFYSLGIEQVSSPASLSSFGYRKAITIDKTKVSGSLANFPVLVNLPADASLQAHAQADADDILFTASSVAWNTGTVNDKLALEIESYNSTTGSLTAWVKIPNLSSTADTVIYMYYGNTSITSQQNKTAVWDNNTKMVQHMNQNPGGTAPQMTDSTQYGNDGTSGGMGSGDVIEGKVGKGLSFDGSSKYVNLGTMGTFGGSRGNGFTAEAWIYNADTTAIGTIIGASDASSGANSFSLKTNAKADGTVLAGSLRSSIADLTASKWLTGGTNANNITVNTWHHVVFSSFPVNNILTFYVDGNLQSTAYIDRTTPKIFSNFISELYLGAYNRPGGAVNFFNGFQDEVRLSSTIRSADWISTEYNNQSNPTEFYSLGIEEVASPAKLSSFGYRKAITIDHTKVAGDLTNFPILINLPADASLASHAQADNDDILFTSSAIAWNAGTVNDKLASEIESYNSTTGSLTAWVKIPNLSSTTDTVINMYYGNGTVTTQQNKTAVWDNNIRGIWHMNQDPGGTAPQVRDSTVYHNDGTTGGNMTSSNLVVGQIGNATSFDGIDDTVITNTRSSLKPASISTSAWVRLNYDGNRHILAVNWIGYTLEVDANGYPYFQTYDGSNATISKSPTALAFGQWQYVTGSFNSATKEVKFFLNGVEAKTVVATNPMVYSNGSFQLSSVAYANGAVNGSLDEIHVSSTVRSAQWISTEYNNQSNPTEFYSLGIEEVSSPAQLSSFGYRKAITIDHTKVSADLANFPLLINLPADTSLQAHAQSDNDDILFTPYSVAWNTGTVNDKLAHEIESYNSTSGSLTAWVKIPNLSSTQDTVIYMYYGNASATSQQNKTAVWDNNTKMVQHMNQAGTGAAGDYKDSTVYANNSTNATSQPTVATGQIGNAESFDGVSQYVGVGGKESLFLKNSGTISTWIYPTALASSGYNVIYTSEGSADVNKTPYLRLEGGVLRAYLGNGTTIQAINSSFRPALNQWHYVVLSWNGVNAKVYMDNQTYTTSQTVTVQFTGAPYNISRYTTVAERTFQGSIDEVRISNTARSAQWIAAEYANQSSPSTFSSLSSEQVYRLEISGSSAQTTGNSQTITLSAKDVNGSVRSDFTGDKVVTFSGANAAPDGTLPTCTDKDNSAVAFGLPTTLVFTNGVATCNLKLYKAETAAITANGINAASTGLSVAVSPGTLNNFLVDAPNSGNSGENFAVAITSRDAWNNTTRTVSGSTAITASLGTISLTTISAGNFTDDGVWSGNVKISGIVERPSVVLAATNGSSSGSDSISILGIPADPQNASASRNSDYSMTLTWQDVSTVETGYLIERKINDGSGFGSYVQIGSAAANASSFTDDAASNPGNAPIPDRSYQYRVRAVNSIGNSGYTEDAAVHYTTPNTPSNVFGTRLNDNSFRINYTDNSAITDTHRIERCSNANCGTSFETYVGIFTSGPQADSISIYPDSRYRWQVRAEASGISSNYEVSNFEYTTPAAPVIQNPVYISSSQINVNWTDSSSYEDGFRIEVSIDGGAWQEVTPGTNTAGANVTSYAYASTGDHNYKFRVRAHIGATVRNGELFSAYSGESVPVYTASAAPIIGTPVVNSSTSVTWNWTDTSAFEENFHLHFAAGLGTDINDIPANSTSYTSTGFVPNTKYSVHVHSYRTDAGESDPSNPSAEVYTFANIPAELVIRKDSQQQLTASWNANQNPAGTQYFVENMNIGKNSGWIVDTSWASGNLNCGTKYSFRVKARNESGIETAFLGIADGMTEDCSPGLPSSYTNPPKSPQKTADNPAGELKVLINKDEKYAASPVVSLSLFAGSDAVRVAVSNSTDFKDALLVPYQKEIKWNLDSSAEVSGDGMRTVYVKFYTKYGAASSAVLDSIILDTTGPELSVADLKSKYLLGDSVSISGETEAGARVVYNLDSRSLGAATAENSGRFSLNLGSPAEGSHVLKLFTQDSLGNASDIYVYYFDVEKAPEAAPAVPVPTAVPYSPVSPSGPSSSAPQTPSTSVSQTPVPTASPSGSDAPGSNPVSPAPSVPPSDDSAQPPVPSEAPASMSGEWNLLEVKPFPSGISTQDVGMIVEKFPEFKEIFKSLGISDFAKSAQLQNASFMIPGLSEAIGLDSVGLSSGLSAIATPVAELPVSLKKEIPENILFIKTKDGNMDVNSDLAFENGAPNQKISLLPGKSFELVLRPDGDMDSVKGYLTYKGKQASSDAGIMDKIGMLFGRFPVAHAEDDIEEKLVLSEFDYNDGDNDGIWTADISTPQVAGEYELITVLNYKDIKIGSKTIRMVTVIDPEGYVYRTEKDGEKTRITNAVVSLYWFNPETKKYELWNAEKYQQKNPQTTDDRGTYSFLVPPGSYYLEAEAGGYKSYQGKPFDVTAGNGVHTNIELVPEMDWKDQITWERVIIAIFGIALGCNFYWDRRTRKKLKAGNP